MLPYINIYASIAILEDELTNSVGDDRHIRHCWGIGTTSSTQSTNQSNLDLMPVMRCHKWWNFEPVVSPDCSWWLDCQSPSPPSRRCPSEEVGRHRQCQPRPALAVCFVLQSPAGVNIRHKLFIHPWSPDISYQTWSLSCFSIVIG